MYAKRMGLSELEVSSAGTRAVRAHPIHPEAARVIDQLGGDPSNFSARQLTHKLASNADLVVTMTTEQRDRVLELAPRQLRRTFTLNEVAYLASEHDAESVADLSRLRPLLPTTQQLPEIPDPIGQSPGVFSAVGLQIAQAVPTLLKLRLSD